MSVLDKMDINERNLNGWAISTEALTWILENIPLGSRILELGSGLGTKELVKHYTVYSIEQNEEWIGYVSDVHYIHSPLKLYSTDTSHFKWFDEEIIRNKAPKDYDFLIIDAPIGSDRENFIHFQDLFNTNVPILVDDTHRCIDRTLALKLAESLDKNWEEYLGHEKNFIILKNK